MCVAVPLWLWRVSRCLSVDRSSCKVITALTLEYVRQGTRAHGERLPMWEKDWVQFPGVPYSALHTGTLANTVPWTRWADRGVQGRLPRRPSSAVSRQVCRFVFIASAVGVRLREAGPRHRCENG